MATFTFILNRERTEADFVTFARKARLPYRSDTFVCIPSYNAACASNGVETVGSEDIIYLNLSFPLTELNDGWIEPGNDWNFRLDIEYEDGSELTFDDINAVAAGYDAGLQDQKPFQRVAIDMRLLSPLLTKSCFAIRITGRRNSSDPTPLVCYYGLYRLPQYDTTPETGEDVPCEKTVLIQGVYFGYDCDGNYYGPIAEGNENEAYESPVSFRWEGDFETTGWKKSVIESDTGQTVSSQEIEKARLRLKPMPKNRARQLAKILMADVILVNGEEWQEKKGLEKNNDNSDNWHAVLDFERVSCERNNLGCD